MAGQAKVSIDEASLLPFSPEELHSALGSVIVIDAREASQFDEGTIAGARRLGKSDLLFSSSAAWVQALVQELVASNGPIIVFSEYGMVGQNTGRDIFVIWYLHESGVALSRLGRLIGGIRAWMAANLPLEKLRPQSTADLAGLLQSINLPATIAQTLTAGGITLEGLLELQGSKGRGGVLSALVSGGVVRLVERQAIANAVGRESRTRNASLVDDAGRTAVQAATAGQ